MEWSIARQIAGLSDQYSRNFLFTSTPSNDFVNPGIGGSFNLFNYYVPLHNRTLLEIQKQVEPAVIESVPGQSGSGTNTTEEEHNNADIGLSDASAKNEKDDKSFTSVDSEDILLNKNALKMDPQIYKSFQHPAKVATDKIVFVKKRQNSNKDSASESKRPKVQKGGVSDLKHSFQFY